MLEEKESGGAVSGFSALCYNDPFLLGAPTCKQWNSKPTWKTG